MPRSSRPSDPVAPEAPRRVPRNAGDPSDPRRVPRPTPALLLAEKWAHHRRDGTSWVWGVFEEGEEAVVRIHHGSAPIYVRDLGKCLMVLGFIDLPPDVRAKLAQANPQERSEFYGVLRGELMACPRIGFSLAPPVPGEAETPVRVALDQTLQIAENDAASFNRFCDAIQETETILLRVSDFLRGFVARSQEASVYSSGSRPPSDIYL